MKRYLPIFIIFFISCSYGASEELESELLEAVADSTDAITCLLYTSDAADEE